MIPVTETHVEYMRDCVPPVYMSYSGMYHVVQCGEPVDHKNGKPVYSTFMCATQEAENAGILDSRMKVGQWYDTGLSYAITHSL